MTRQSGVSVLGFITALANHTRDILRGLVDDESEVDGMHARVRCPVEALAGVACKMLPRVRTARPSLAYHVAVLRHDLLANAVLQEVMIKDLAFRALMPAGVRVRFCKRGSFRVLAAAMKCGAVPEEEATAAVGGVAGEGGDEGGGHEAVHEVQLLGAGYAGAAGETQG